MAPDSASLFNMTTDQSNTTTKAHNSEFCPPFSNAAFETLDNSVPYLVNAALNVSLAIATTFANLLVLLAMRHVTSIRLPSKLLLCSLVLTDLGAGLVIQPEFTVFLFKKVIHSPHSSPRCSMYYSFAFTGSLLALVSLCTITAISLDRYTALFFYIRYQQIVTTRRACGVLTFIWSCSLFFASSSLWNKELYMFVLLTGSAICLLVSSVSYIKIYRRLQGQHVQQVQPQAQNQAQQQAVGTLNMAKYKRTASAMICVHVLFVICYLPFLCAILIVSTIAHTALTQCIWEFAYTVVLLNSCLNPFVYCLRLPGIRTEVIKELRKFCCRNPQQ